MIRTVITAAYDTLSDWLHAARPEARRVKFGISAKPEMLAEGKTHFADVYDQDTERGATCYGRSIDDALAQVAQVVLSCPDLDFSCDHTNGTCEFCERE